MKNPTMMVEAGGGLVDQRKETMITRHVKNNVKYFKKTIKKERRYKKSRDHQRHHHQSDVVPRVPKVLQKLFDSCREVFRGPGTVPPDSDVNELCSILDNMKPEHVGLSKNIPFLNAKSAVKGTPRVAYTTIYQCDEFSLCIFFLQSTAVIPLHNHPGMTVFSKLLLGKMHIKSYDWVNLPSSEGPVMSPCSPHLRLARLKANRVFTSRSKTSVLYPTTGGNIHEFTAITPCAVLDVLGPPYSKDDDRDCSYYKDLPYSAVSNGESKVSEEESDYFGWLEEIEVPENSKMERIEYKGPQIIETSFL